MNRFVLILSVGDGCTYSCEKTIPIEAESVEEIYIKLSETALMVSKEYEEDRKKHLEIHADMRKALTDKKVESTGQDWADKFNSLRKDADFELFGHKFDAHELTYVPEKHIEKKKGRSETIYGEREFSDGDVQILTLDEWYAEKH